MKSCSECGQALHKIKIREYTSGDNCNSCQEPINSPTNDESILTGFCKQCSDSIQLLWYFQETVNADLDMWDDIQRDAAGSAISDLGDLEKAQKLADFVTGLKIGESHIIASPLDMYENLNALSTIYAYLNKTNYEAN